MLIFLTFGCGLGNVDVTIDAPACTDWEFGEDFEQADVLVEYSQTRIDVVRAGVFMDCDARFTPDILAEGNSITIDEVWEGEEGDCCWAPEVVLDTQRAGTIQVQWYDITGSEVYNQEIDTRD